MTKSHLSRKGLFGLHIPIMQFIEGSRGRNPEAELKQRLWRNSAYWLTPHGLLSRLSYTSWHHLPRCGPPGSELGPPASVTNQENAPQTHLWATWRRHSLSYDPSSQIRLGCVKLTKTTGVFAEVFLYLVLTLQFLLSFRSFPCILNTNAWLDKCLQLYFPSLCLAFSSHWQCLTQSRRFLISMKFILPFIFLSSYMLGFISKNSSPTLDLLLFFGSFMSSILL